MDGAARKWFTEIRTREPRGPSTCAVPVSPPRSGDARPAVRVSGTAPAWRPSHLHLGHLCSVHCALWLESGVSCTWSSS
jgi:hypothetical protein